MLLGYLANVYSCLFGHIEKAFNRGAGFFAPKSGGILLVALRIIVFRIHPA